MARRDESSMTDPISQRAHRASSRPWLDRWMACLRTIGNIQAWILLTVFYVVIMTPFGIVYRLFANPGKRRKGESHWQPFAHSYERMERAREQS